MNGLEGVLDKYGVNIAILAATLFLCWYLIKHFMCFVKEATAERKAMTAQYQGFLENHINENTHAQEQLTQSIKDLARDIKDGHLDLKNLSLDIKTEIRSRR